MSEISVSFMHPTDGRIISVTLDGSMTAQEAIGELIASDFVSPNDQGYELVIKGGSRINNSDTLVGGGAKNGDTLKVIPSTNAGFKFYYF